MKIGRPTDYNTELANKICSLIAMGRSLNSICGKDENKESEFPSRTTVYNWFSKHKEFVDSYARAKEDSAFADADKLDEIAENVLDGTVEPQAARVAADIIKWSAAHKRPKKFGDKIHTEHSGNVGLTDMSDDGLLKRLEELKAEKEKLE